MWPCRFKAHPLNSKQELKGNIRVVARVRPLSDGEVSAVAVDAQVARLFAFNSTPPPPPLPPPTTRSSKTRMFSYSCSCSGVWNSVFGACGVEFSPKP